MKRNFILTIIFAFIGLVLALIVNNFYGLVKINGYSMEPTLKNNEYHLMQKKVKNYKVNDLIVADIVTVNNGQKTKIIKRVIATEGQTIEIKDGILYRDDQVIDEPYLKEKIFARETFDKLKVTEGEVFVLGDNRNESIDSREQGTIKISEIIGKIIK